MQVINLWTVVVMAWNIPGKFSAGALGGAIFISAMAYGWVALSSSAPWLMVEWRYLRSWRHWWRQSHCLALYWEKQMQNIGKFCMTSQCLNAWLISSDQCVTFICKYVMYVSCCCVFSAVLEEQDQLQLPPAPPPRTCSQHLHSDQLAQCHSLENLMADLTVNAMTSPVRPRELVLSF